MMWRCWDANPSERPTIKELREFSYSKLEEIYKNENLKSNSRKDTTSLFKRLFKFSKIKKSQKNGIDFDNNNSNISGGSSSNSLQRVHKSHPLAYHTSRILDDEIVKSKNVKSNDSSLSHLDINSLIISYDYLIIMEKMLNFI